MTEVPSNDAKASAIGRIGSQPIVFAAAALTVIVVGIGSIALWRAYSGVTPEQERIASSRQIQARVAQTSEQIVAKTKDLEVTQQQSIDQLQVVQDQLQVIQQMLAAQRTDTKRLSEQVGDVTGTLDSLRQSFASSPAPESAAPPPARKKWPRHTRASGRRAKSRS